MKAKIFAFIVNIKATAKVDELRLVNGIIYKSVKLYVPPPKRDEIIGECHDCSLAGHGGIEATKARLTNFWWPSLADDVKKYVNSCELCQRRKAERDKPTGDMYSHLVFEPHKQVAIDCLGPITESLTGKKFVMVAIDVFTRFVDAKAVSRIDAPSFAKFLTQYCGRFGIPDTILTDNAPTFVSAMIRELTDSLGVDHIKSTPQHSRGNAVVERLLQTLQEKLSLITSNSNPSLDWEVALPISVLSINTSLHKATGYSPYELTFGIRHPLTSKNIRTKRTPHDLYADMVRLRMESDHANVVALNSEAQARSKSYFDKTHRPRVFKEGDLVLSKTIGRRSKLSNRFESQTFKVLSRTNDIYEIESTSTGIRRHRHTSFLKPFKTRQVTNTQGASMTSTNILLYCCWFCKHANCRQQLILKEQLLLCGPKRRNISTRVLVDFWS